MNVAAVLLAYAALLGVGLPRILIRTAALERAPWLALAVWQAAAVSFIAAILLAGVALAVPSLTVNGGLADLLHACVLALRAQYATPGGALTGLTGLALDAAVVIRGATMLVSRASFSHKARAEHRDALTVLGTRHPGLGITVVNHDCAAVYCVPGRSSRVVVTSGALKSLDEEELRAVLAHERAHLAARHHLAVGFASGLARAFPRVPLLVVGASEAVRLVELLADDVASRSAGRRPVATALVALAAGPTPAMTLAASGPTAIVRVKRMLAPAHPLGVLASATIVVTSLLVLSAPIAIAAGPAWAARHTNLCPLGYGSAADSNG